MRSIACNILIPQLLWSGRVRRNLLALWLISLVVNVGMWLERFIIVVTSLHADYVPAAWGMYHPTFWDWATYFGTIGLFLTLLFIFIRVLPVISIAEMRELVVRDGRARQAARSPHDGRPWRGRAAMKKAKPDLYGVMAEFTDAERLLEAAHRTYAAGLPPPRRLHAGPGRGAGRGHRVPPEPAPAGRLAGRPPRRRRGVLHAVVLVRDRLPAQHRRPAR